MSVRSQEYGQQPYGDGSYYSDKQAMVSQSPMMVKHEMYQPAVSARPLEGPTMAPATSPVADGRSWNGSPASAHPGYGPPPPIPPQFYHHPVPPPAPRPGPHSSDDDARRILGLRPATFFLSVALIVVIVIGAVGGGVGGTVAVENARRDALAQVSASAASSRSAAASTVTVTVRAGGSETTTALAVGAGTSTSSSKAATATKVKVARTGILDFDCAASAASGESIKLDSKTWNFSGVCGRDFNGNVDILAVVSYTHRDCLQACASHNRNLKRDACIGVVFYADLDVIPLWFGNCFLKNSTGTTNQGTDTGRVGYSLTSVS